MTKGQVIIVQSTIKFFVAINDSFITVKIMMRSNMFIKTLLYRFQISLNTSLVHVVPLQNYRHHIRKKIRTSCLSFFCQTTIKKTNVYFNVNYVIRLFKNVTFHTLVHVPDMYLDQTK